MKRTFLIIFVGTMLIVVLGLSLYRKNDSVLKNTSLQVTPVVSITPILTASPSATLTPKPLSFAEMNAAFGPCVKAPTLMYHHIADEKIAEKEGFKSLNVDTHAFELQMDYLKTRGYSVVTMQNVVDFFDSGTPLSAKPVLLTFDDGYQDFFTNAFPILKARGFPATLFLPTGLTNNSGYVSWDEVKEMSGNNIEIANHTWSHKSMKREKGLDDFEIHTADVQLGDRGLNNPKVFAYPYGEISKISQDELVVENYNLAFTTRYGTVLCKKQRLELPRVRIGNSSLGNYGI